MKKVRRWMLLTLLPCCLLSAPVGAETAGGSFGVHLKINSVCSAQQGQNAYSPVMVTCRPGTTPYQTQVYQLGDGNMDLGGGYPMSPIGGMADNQPPAAIQQMMYFSQTLYRIVSVTF